MNNPLVSLITLNEQQVYATVAQQAAITALTNNETKGGTAVVTGYRPTSGYVEDCYPVQNIHFNAKVSNDKLNDRKETAISTVTFASLSAGIAKDEKLSQLSASEAEKVFDTRKAFELDSIQKTRDGDRSDGHRQGHDRCYITVAQGIKVNLITSKRDDGLMHPDLTDDGYPVVASILISALFIHVATVTEGTRKVVNSGNPVRMSNLIKKVINKPTLQMRMISLKDGNFDRLSIDKERLIPAEFLSLQ